MGCARLAGLGALGLGVRQDLARRLPHYASDFSLKRGRLRVLAAATYIFCASAIPALAFGEQLSSETGGTLSAVHVLAATALAGVAQALAGGQPLLIVGVAEPTVLVYSYLYQFAEGRQGLGQGRFLAFAGWACVWAAALMVVLAATNACAYTRRFTRFSGELFGALIALLFMQQAVKGSVQEFRRGADSPAWQLVNGLWSLVLAGGLLGASLALRGARSCRFLRAPARGLLADYGAALMLVAFSGLSFAVRGGGAPSRVSAPNVWQVKDTWTVAADMGQLEGRWIAAALIPALIITVLFFFDHNVSAQLAQQEEFNLKRGTAYHWDFLLLGLMTLLCGLIGLPPVNGVLPQSPMHTKALAKVASGKPRGKPRGKQQQQQQQQESQQRRPAVAYTPSATVNSAPATPLPGSPAGKGSLELARARMHTSPSAQGLLRTSCSSFATTSEAASADPPPAPGSHATADGAAAANAAAAAVAAADGRQDEVVPVRVYEQRVSGLAQSLGVGACLAAMPAIRQIPTAVLWGYFAFMAVESLPGSQLWDRTLLLATDPARRAALLERGHAPYLETVPFRTTAWFTAFQLACLAGVYAVTWAGVAGILFPIPIMLLVPLRQYVMPRFFACRRHLQELDAAAEEQAAPLSREQALQEAAAQGLAAAAGPAEGAAAAAAGYESGGERPLPDSELQHMRVLHRLSRESLIRRRQSLDLDAAAAAAAAGAAGRSGGGSGGSVGGSGGSLQRRSHDLGLHHV